MAAPKGLFFKIGADDSELQKALSDSEKSVKGFASKIAGPAAAAAKAFAAIGAAAVAATALIVKSNLESIDSTAKFADSIGISTEALTELEFAAGQTGVSSDKLRSSMERLTRGVAEAADGSGTASKAFDRLGISAIDMGNATPDQQMNILADAFEGVDSQAEKTRLAVELFGRSGIEMVNMLDAGSAGLDEMREQAVAAGLSLSRIDAAAVEQANDSIALAASTTKAFGQSLTVQLAPAMSGIADGFTDWAIESQFFAKAADVVFDFIIGSIKVVTSLIDRGVTAVHLWSAGFKAWGVAGLEAALFIVKAFEPVFDFIGENIAKIIEALNRIPKIDIPVPEFDSGSMVEGLESMKETLTDGVLDSLEAADNAWNDGLRASFEGILERTEEHQEEVEEQLQGHEQRKTAIVREGEEARTDIVEMEADAQEQIVTGGNKNILKNINTFGKRAFDMNKTARISSAVISGGEAAVSAFAAGMSTGGPWAPAIAAAYTTASLASTGAQISRIKSASYGKSGGGGGSSAVAPSVPSGGAGGGASGGGNTSFINIVGSDGSTFTRDQIEDLIGDINAAVGDGVRLAS